MMEAVLTDRWKCSSTMKVLIKDHTGCPHIAFCFSWPQFGVQPVIPKEGKELWAALCIEPDTHTQQHRLLSTPRKVSFHHHHFLRRIYSLIQLDMQQRHRKIHMDFYKKCSNISVSNRSLAPPPRAVIRKHGFNISKQTQQNPPMLPWKVIY